METWVAPASGIIPIFEQSAQLATGAQQRPRAAPAAAVRKSRREVGIVVHNILSTIPIGNEANITIW